MTLALIIALILYKNQYNKYLVCSYTHTKIIHFSIFFIPQTFRNLGYLLMYRYTRACILFIVNELQNRFPALESIILLFGLLDSYTFTKLLLSMFL